MGRRYSARTNAHNETPASTHREPSAGDDERGIPGYPQPLPGEHHYPKQESARPQDLEVPPAKPYYSGGTAHGVRSPVVHGGRPAPKHEDRDYYRTEDEEFPVTGAVRGKPQPVYVIDGTLHKAAFRQVTLLPGADPATLADRNDLRISVRFMNETQVGYNQPLTAPPVPATNTAQVNYFATPVAVTVTGGTVTAIQVNGAATGLTSGTVTVPAGGTITLVYTVAPTWTWNGQTILGVRLKNGPDTENGSMLPSGQGRYFEVESQEQVYAIADPSVTVPQVISVIEIYKVARLCHSIRAGLTLPG